MKTTLLIVSVVVGVLSALGEATGLQLLPFVLLVGLVCADLYVGKKVTVWAFALSLIMFLVNLYLVSWLDMAFWLFAGLVYLPKDKKE